MSRNRSKYVHDPNCLSLTHDGDCDCPRPRTLRVTAPAVTVDPLCEALAGLLRVIDGTVSESDAATDIAFAREALAAAPVPVGYEYRACWVGPGGVVMPDGAGRVYGKREWAECRLASRPRVLRSHIERRTVPGPWERVS